MKKYLFLLLIGLASCVSAQENPDNPKIAESVKTGAMAMAEDNFVDLAGHKIGLITNHTAMLDDTLHLIDALAGAQNLELVALFGPEHGLRGLADAGAKLSDGIDDKTGLPVYSLYGKNRKPSQEMLAGVDMLVFDIQDVGARFYTYISTMGESMAAAAEADIPFVVLDRPNPLGGEYLAGPIRHDSLSSFVGRFPIPVVHGMTIGELALMIKGEKMIAGLENLDLRVVQVKGLKRNMLWPATGLNFIKTSPNIPDFETVLLYPGICLIEATTISEGRGTEMPFKLAGGPEIDGKQLAETLNVANLPGVTFTDTTFTPISIVGMSEHPKQKDIQVHGVKITVTNQETFLPFETGIYVLHAMWHQVGADQKDAFITQGRGRRWLRMLYGHAGLYEMLENGSPPAEIIASWQGDIEGFKLARKPYLLYD